MPHRAAIQAAISPARMGTFMKAARLPNDLQSAIDLYNWNAHVSAAFLHPLHICEVVVRNAISEAIEATHGAGWPWSRGFLLNLPDSGNFNPRKELVLAAAKVRRRHGPAAPTGAVVAEIKFAFWESMLTARFDAGLWDKHLHRVLPQVSRSTKYSVVRASMNAQLKTLRHLRNRIAHHEPVFQMPLADHLDAISQLVGMRCWHTRDWLMRSQKVGGLLAARL